MNSRSFTEHPSKWKVPKEWQNILGSIHTGTPTHGLISPQTHTYTQIHKKAHHLMNEFETNNYNYFAKI